MEGLKGLVVKIDWKSAGFDGDSEILNEDLPEDGLFKGDVGIVVHVHQAGEAYEVEFLTMDGATVAVRTLKSAQVQAVSAGMIPHVREIAV